MGETPKLQMRRPSGGRFQIYEKQTLRPGKNGITLIYGMRFDFDREKSRDVKRKTSRTTPSADEIAEMASRGEDVSGYFTNRFTVVGPVRRVNVDLTQGMLRALDERAASLNISRQAVIKTLLRRALAEERSRRPGKKRAG